MARAVDLRALDERIRNVVKIALERPRADRQRKHHIADQQRPIAAEQPRLIHQRIDGQQQDRLRERLAHHEHTHDELPAAIAELCEAVSRERADDRRHQARPEGHDQAVFQVAHDLWVRHDVDDVVKRQRPDEEIAAERLARRLERRVDEPEQREEDEKAVNWTLKKIVILFSVCAVLLIGSSIALTYLTSLIQEAIPALSGSVAGALLLGIGTSIPEIISTAQLFRKKNYDAGYGNMIGSCTFDFAILALADFVSWHQMNPGLNNVVDRGIFIAEPDAIQFEIAGLAVCAGVVAFCALRYFTKLFQNKKVLGYVLTGILATGCVAGYLLVFIL